MQRTLQKTNAKHQLRHLAINGVDRTEDAAFGKMWALRG
jgi:hypothetical protein